MGGAERCCPPSRRPLLAASGLDMLRRERRRTAGARPRKRNLHARTSHCALRSPAGGPRRRRDQHGGVAHACSLRCIAHGPSMRSGGAGTLETTLCSRCGDTISSHMESERHAAAST
jgi:hypothetical protein